MLANTKGITCNHNKLSIATFDMTTRPATCISFSRDRCSTGIYYTTIIVHDAHVYTHSVEI